MADWLPLREYTERLVAEWIGAERDPFVAALMVRDRDKMVRFVEERVLPKAEPEAEQVVAINGHAMNSRVFKVAARPVKHYGVTLDDVRAIEIIWRGALARAAPARPQRRVG